MAGPRRKQGAGGTRAGGTPGDRLIDAALNLAASKGWRETSLGDIAAAAGMPLHEAYALHRSKLSIRLGFIRRIDAAVLAGTEPGGSAATRERLFDTLMRRYEALRPHKDAVKALARASFGDPAFLVTSRALARSMRWMLEASSISTAGCRGRLLTHLVLALYLSVLRVFLADDTPDLSRTMAELDRGLKRGEELCRLLPGRRRGAAAAEAA